MLGSIHEGIDEKNHEEETMKNGEKPAYPFTHRTGITEITNATGLTKRERFAMAAMQGLLSNPPEQSLVNNGYPHYGTISQEAVCHADALLKALEE